MSALRMLDGKFGRFGYLVDLASASFIERRFIAALLLSEDFTFEPMNQFPLAVARDRFGIVLGYPLNLLNLVGLVDFDDQLRISGIPSPK